jgi:hypothetical protein
MPWRWLSANRLMLRSKASLRVGVLLTLAAFTGIAFAIFGLYSFWESYQSLYLVSRNKSADYVDLQRPPDSSILSNGDLIFRRGRSAISDLVVQTDPDAAFSHVGLVWRQDSHVRVIHVSVGEENGAPDVVRVDPIDRFLSSDRAAVYAIYRLRSDPQRHGEIAVRAALHFLAERVPFDFDLNLNDPSRLYCTELVWRAYLESGIEIAVGSLETINVLGMKRSYLSIGQILRNPELTLVVGILPTNTTQSAVQHSANADER